MDWENYLFGFGGRINRAKMWLYLLVVICAEILLFAVLWALTGMAGLTAFQGSGSPVDALSGSGAGIVAGILMIAFVVGLIWSGLAVAVKRLHDRNKSGWWLVFFYVMPLVLDAVVAVVVPPGENRAAASMLPALIAMVLALAALGIVIWAFVEFYCLRGTVGDNRFGPDPLAKIAPPA